jgi:hypothetical protein
MDFFEVKRLDQGGSLGEQPVSEYRIRKQGSEKLRTVLSSTVQENFAIYASANESMIKNLTYFFRQFDPKTNDLLQSLSNCYLTDEKNLTATNHQL